MGENQPADTEFIRHLHAEKLTAEEARTNFTLRKLTYVTALLGLGSLEIDVGQVTATGALNLGALLYLAPLVALASDLYILAEDYSVKRIGAFLGKNSPDPLEHSWEEWVAINRDQFAPFAMSGLTTLVVLAALIILIVTDSFFPLLAVPWAIVILAVTWWLHLKYRRLREQVRQNAALDR
jgi:hypothetical protein